MEKAFPKPQSWTTKKGKTVPDVSSCVRKRNPGLVAPIANRNTSSPIIHPRAHNFCKDVEKAVFPEFSDHSHRAHFCTVKACRAVVR